MFCKQNACQKSHDSMAIQLIDIYEWSLARQGPVKLRESRPSKAANNSKRQDMEIRQNGFAAQIF